MPRLDFDGLGWRYYLDTVSSTNGYVMRGSGMTYITIENTMPTPPPTILERQILRGEVLILTAPLVQSSRYRYDRRFRVTDSPTDPALLPHAAEHMAILGKMVKDNDVLVIRRRDIDVEATTDFQANCKPETPYPGEPMPEPRFSLGQVFVTPGVRALELGGLEVLELFQRHQLGDWGEVSPSDWQKNNRALEKGWPVCSVYDLDQGTIWLLTEPDRNLTTLLLPDEVWEVKHAC